MILTFACDGVNRLTRKTAPASVTGAAGYSVSYGYDVNDLQLYARFGSGTGPGITSNYDGFGRLASTSGYNVSRPHSVKGLYEYAGVGPNAYTYDANGNLTSDGTSSYVYDAENRLVSRSNGTTLSYDQQGRLWRTSGPTETTVFEYDGDRLVEEFDGTGIRIRVYGHGPGEDEPLLWWEGPSNWQRRYFHADHQGSVIAIANDNGTPQRINATDPWGIRNSGDWGRFGLTGQVFLADLGMYYYKARIYSPTLGRFLQTDPIGYKDQVNLYAYVGNDPPNRADPSGRQSCEPHCDSALLAPAAVRVAPAAAAATTSTALAAGTAVTAPLLLSGDTPTREPVYITYTKTNLSTGEVYSGRASMAVPAGTPLTPKLGQQILNCRECGHHMNEKGYGPARLDRMSKGYGTIRGREQQLINHFGGAKSMGGSSGNAINGISVYNPLRSLWLGESDSAFGHLKNNSSYPEGLLPW